MSDELHDSYKGVDDRGVDNDAPYYQALGVAGNVGESFVKAADKMTVLCKHDGSSFRVGLILLIIALVIPTKKKKPISLVPGEG